MGQIPSVEPKGGNFMRSIMDPQETSQLGPGNRKEG